MHHFTHSYEAVFSTHFNIILPTAKFAVGKMTPHKKYKHSSVPFFPRLTLSWHELIIFRIFIIETKVDFVSFNDKHLQRRRKFVAERDFPILNSYTGQVFMSESQQGSEICDVISRKRYSRRQTTLL